MFFNNSVDVEKDSATWVPLAQLSATKPPPHIMIHVAFDQALIL